MVRQTRFIVEGMHCPSCVARIEKAIRFLPGVTTVAIDLPTSQATVEYYAAKTTPEEIYHAITAAGYKVAQASS